MIVGTTLNLYTFVKIAVYRLVVLCELKHLIPRRAWFSRCSTKFSSFLPVWYSWEIMIALRYQQCIGINMSTGCPWYLSWKDREEKVVNGFGNSPEEEFPSALQVSGYCSQSHLTNIVSCPKYIFTTQSSYNFAFHVDLF